MLIMKLKVKQLKWSAGLPVAILNERTAKEIGVNTKGRVSIKTFFKRSREIFTVVDIIKSLVKENEIMISSEIKKNLGVDFGNFVDVNLAPFSESLKFIKKKLNGEKLSRSEINEIIQDVVDNSLSEEEIALFVSAVYKQGMDFNELIFLIEAILSSGNKLSIKNKFVADKHSIGGVAGNRTTPIVVSICASAGLIMPKTSSRAITSAAGTADVMETVSKVDFSIKELKKILKKTNAFIVWGGTLGMAVADSKILEIEEKLTIDPEAFLLASIMSKKLAAGSKNILIDIPYGKGSKIENKKRAIILKKKFERLGRFFNKNLKCVLTNGSQPIGNGIGPALEMLDIIKILNPKEKGPKDLEKKSLFLAGKLLEMTGKSKKGKGEEMAKEILISGKAFEKFKEIIKAQGGSLKKIKLAKFKKNILSKKSGKILEIDNKKISFLARLAGCPMDKSSGVYLYLHINEKVKKREKILTVYASSKERLNQAISTYYKTNPVRY